MKFSPTLFARRMPAALVLLSLSGLPGLSATLLGFSNTANAADVPRADVVLPDETVAFMSFPDADDFLEKWDRTQIGQFTADESTRPFMNYLKDRIIERYGNIEKGLGMTFDDVTAAASGEVGLGMLHREGERACIALTVDSTGRTEEADKLLDKAKSQLANRGGRRSTQTHAGVELVIYALPKKEGRKNARNVVYFRQGDLLCAVDGIDYAKGMVDRIVAAGDGSLTDLHEYGETMRRCEAESQNMAPDVRWFAAPFRWDTARRTLMDGEELVDRQDTISILFEQGFDAIRGIGGYVNLAVTTEQDIVHRTAVYAPPKPGAEGRPAKDKYTLAMRMAELPNRASMIVEEWAPRMTATYLTANVDLLNAFDHVDTLFDAMSGYDGAFENTIGSFQDDPYGPEINVREQLVRQLGRRVTMMTDYKLPITPDCERYLFVVEVAQPGLLRSPIDKLMKHDGALRREVNGIQFWEIVPEEEINASTDLGDGLLTLDDTGVDEEPEQRERVIRRAAVCLHKSQLIVASDVEFLEQVLFGIEERESLAGSYDFQTTKRHLDDLASNERCSWSFFRTDESIRPSYELIRQGLMPQSQSFFGRFLNEILTTPEDEELGIVRKQRIDGSTLPNFELARRYFGPAGQAIRSDDDGWFMTGVVLSKAEQ